ncbi:MAG TPA: TonB-dependent receptor [Vicinamibacterales bacterium]|nr:TonB-dependent receptor [Vicinamibacterales bacterium]HOQ59773.1 TonB-dependent receptor [Vicinamibacterales bacterium]
MRRLPTLVAAAGLVCLVSSSVPAGAQPSAAPSAPPPAAPSADATLTRAGVGAIRGLVLDTQGRPLGGAMVSALGSTVAFALTDRDGRFLLSALPPGAYVVRVHLDGFAPSPRQMVEVGPAAAPSIVSVAMKTLARPPDTPDGRRVLAAGLVSFAAESPAAPPEPSGADEGEADRSETAWRLRHLKRGVLKTIDIDVAAPARAEAPADDPAREPFTGRLFVPSARYAASLFNDFPLTGQVNLVTTSSFGGPAFDPRTPSNSIESSTVAYLSIGSRAGALGSWSVSAATSPGNVGSWFVDGSLVGRTLGSHRYVAGLAYSSQRITTAEPFAFNAIRSVSRSIGRVYAFDEWAVSKRVGFGYGLSYLWQDYLPSQRLLSPRVAVTVSPADRFRVKAVLSRSALAPGSDEFLHALNSPAGLWLPAQRAFSPWSPRDGLHAQTTDHFELGVEHDIAAYVVGVRAFRQSVRNQAGALFAAPSVAQPSASQSHYYLATLGDVTADGWGIRVSRPFLGAVRGSVEYSEMRPEWIGGAANAIAQWFGAGGQPDGAAVRDLTASLETDVAPTATRIFVLYKLNSGFARQAPDSQKAGPDRRFDVQVNQSLPFLRFTQADWEVLLAVCNLFSDAAGERSMYDELLVIRPPTRVVGGLRVRF